MLTSDFLITRTLTLNTIAMKKVLRVLGNNNTLSSIIAVCTVNGAMNNSVELEPHTAEWNQSLYKNMRASNASS